MNEGGEAQDMKKRMGIQIFNVVLILTLILAMLPLGAQAASTTTYDKKPVDISKFLRHDVTNPNQLQPVFISPMIDMDSKEKIKVIVELAQKPVSVEKRMKEQFGKRFSAQDEKNALKEVSSAQAEFNTSLKALNVKANITRSYQYVFNGVVVELNANEVSTLAKGKNVKAIYPVVEYHALPINSEPLMSDSGPFIGSNDIWELGYKGEGIKVGVIDTGIDYYHPDLVNAYVGGYDFVDNDNNPYETLPGNSVGEETSHGTHVSGTIAGNHVQDNGIWGIAPEVDLYVYRVLGPGGSGTSDWVIGGIEQAVIDGLDVINLSLGNSLNDPDYPTSIALNNAMLAGTVAVTSAGNSGPDRWTVGSPAASAFAISVGASTPPGDRPVAAGYASVDEELSYDLRLMAYNPSEDYEDLINQSLELVYVGLGYPEDFEGLDLTGKMAFIKRGEIAFVDKIANAKAAGAEAILMFNRDGLDEHIAYYLGDSIHYIPTLDMRGDEGRALLAMMEETPTHEPMILNIENRELKLENNEPIQKPGDIEIGEPIKPQDKVESFALNKPMVDGEGATFTVTQFDVERYDGDELTSFSSRGPVKKTLDIKPDVVAPGDSIRSSVAAYGGDYSNAYERYSGTSMASPHVAALAALVKQAHPDFTPFDIKAVLMNTATLIGEPGEYTVFDQGSGRIQGLEAVTSSVVAEVLDITKYTIDGVLTEVEDITGSISYGQAPLESDFNESKTIRLTNVDGLEHTYQVDVQFLNEDTTGVTLDVDQSTVNVPVDGQIELSATMEVDQSAVEGEYQGYIYFTDEYEESIHIPFVVYVGNIDAPKGFGEVFQLPEDFSPNNDGVLDRTDLYVEIYSQMDLQALLVWDPIAYFDGYNDGYIGQILVWGGEYAIPPGFWRLSGWDGYYYDYRTENWEVLQDGYYTLDWYGWDDEGMYVTWNDVYADTNAPQIDINDEPFETEDNTFTFDGYVEDMYVDFYEIDKIAADYALYGSNGDQLDSGEVVFDEEGNFTLPLSDLSYGQNELRINIMDIAGNQDEYTYEIMNNAIPYATIESGTEVEMSGTYEMTLIADNISHLVGAQIEVDYDDSIFTLVGVEATDIFKAGAGEDGVLELKNDNLGYTLDGLKRATVGVSYKGDVDGINGHNEVLKLTFQVTDDYSYLGDTVGFRTANTKFVTREYDELYPENPEATDVTLISPLDITGEMHPEAFMEEEGLNPNVDYSGIGADLTATDQDGEVVDGTIFEDGSFEFTRVSPYDTFTLELTIPGHFRSVREEIKVVDENEIPSDITVDFGLHLAGDVNADDVIDIYDVYFVASYFGMEAVDGVWSVEQAAVADLNQDDIIDILDLSFVTNNFAKVNQEVPEVNVTPQLELPDDFDFSFDTH